MIAASAVEHPGRNDTDPLGEAHEGLDLVHLRKQFTDFVTVKANEIDEIRQSTRYYHGQQISESQSKILKARGQPEIVFNRLARKINGVVGVVQKLRNDPKAFPRSAKSAAGADLATAVMRYVLDTSLWKDIEADGVLDAAKGAFGVCELTLDDGDFQDPDVGLRYVDPVTYFYDPRSIRPDFSDVRYDGVSRWVSEDEIEEMFPGAGDRLAQDSSGYETTAHDFDRGFLWVNERKKIRLVEHWYKHEGKWKFCIYANWTELARGESPFWTKVGSVWQTRSRYIKFACAVDELGDRYGFVRNMKGPQDAINQHRSKAMHIMNTRQGWARQGVFSDTEKARKELARPDGWLEPNGIKDQDWGVLTQDQEFLKQTQYFQDAKEEIENYGPSPAIVGTNVNQRSGRALAMMQQNGIAELGPFLKNYRTWKFEVYRAVWCTVQRTWQAPRFIRITDDQEVAQFIQLNAMQVGPNGMPQLVNSIAALDVDIILDEGPDTTNVMGDAFDILSSLAQQNVPIPPQVFLELSPLPKTVKDKINGMLNQPPNPQQVQQQQIQMAGMAAKVDDTRAAAMKKQAETQKIMQDAHLAPLQAMHEMTQDRNETALRAHQAVRDERESVAGNIRDDLDSRHSQGMDMLDVALRAQDQAHSQGMSRAQFKDGIDARREAAQASPLSE